MMRPEDIIEKMNLYGPMTIADFGAGAGHFSIPAAKSVTSGGKVFAIDIQEEPLAVLRRHAEKEGLHNIRTMRGDIERLGGSHLQDESVDYVILAHVLFQTTHKKEILGEAFRVLKNSGRMMIMEWDPKKEHVIGPRRESRLSQKDLETLLTAFRHRIDRVFDVGNHHHGIILTKIS